MLKINKKRVLFLCTGNSCRSQMAEGFLRHLAGDKFEVFSAGVKPTQMNPMATEVMSEAGVDISKHKSKPAMGFINQQFDYVITVCDNAKQTCPAFPGRYKKIHWDIPDPAEFSSDSREEIFKEFRRIRDMIKEKIKEFIANPN